MRHLILLTITLAYLPIISAQSPQVLRLGNNAVPVSIGKIDGTWHLTGYRQESTGWAGLHSPLGPQLQPFGTAKTWPNNAYHEAISTHKLPNGHWLSFGRSYMTTSDRYLYFVEHDDLGTVHAAHKWVDSTNALTTVSYAHAYNTDSTQLLTYFQNLSSKTFFAFDRQGEFLWGRKLSPGNMTFTSLLAAPDSGWYALGQINSNSLPSYGFDLILVKLNAQGDREWSHRYLLNGLREVSLQARPTADGGLLLTSTSINDSTSTLQPYYATLMRVDDQGEPLWSRIIGRDGGSGRYQGGCAVELTDGTVLWAGSAKDSVSNQFVNGSIFLVRLDAGGALLDAQQYAYPGACDADAVQFFDVAADHASFWSRVYDGQGFAYELITSNSDFLPPCNTSPLPIATMPWSITDTTVTQSTAPTLTELVRDTLLLNDPAFVLSTTQPCLSTVLDDALEAQAPIHIYPAYNELIVETTTAVTDLRLFDAQGALVLQRQLHGTMERRAVPLPSLAVGLHLVSVRDVNGRWWHTRVVLFR